MSHLSYVVEIKCLLWGSTFSFSKRLNKILLLFYFLIFLDIKWFGRIFFRSVKRPAKFCPCLKFCFINHISCCLSDYLEPVSSFRGPLGHQCPKSLLLHLDGFHPHQCSPKKSQLLQKLSTRSVLPQLLKTKTSLQTLNTALFVSLSSTFIRMNAEIYQI